MYIFWFIIIAAIIYSNPNLIHEGFVPSLIAGINDLIGSHLNLNSFLAAIVLFGCLLELLYYLRKFGKQ